MKRILMTNFHPLGGGGHVTYIQSLLALQNIGDLRIAVATPETSRLYQALRERDYPDLYVCDFPNKLQKEPANIIRSIRRFRSIVADFRPDVVHVNGGPDLSIAVWSSSVRTIPDRANSPRDQILGQRCLSPAPVRPVGFAKYLRLAQQHGNVARPRHGSQRQHRHFERRRPDQVSARRSEGRDLGGAARRAAERLCLWHLCRGRRLQASSTSRSMPQPG